MDKTEYLMNQFKKATRKKYESYCIIRIYTLLNNLKIKIITQQLFKRDDGKIALADLYFPQLKYWIEIDENYHKSIQKEDKKREKEIIRNKKNALDEIITEKIQCDRIDVSKDIVDIDKQIDNIIIKIKDMIKQLGDKFIPWDDVYKTPQEYISKGYIEFEDDAKFRTVLEISELFNKKYKGFRRAYFNVGKDLNEYVWCPRLQLLENECKNIPYINEISEDKKYIYESRKEKNDEFIDKALENDINSIRFVFPKYRDPSGEMMYKYRGIFKLNEKLTKKYDKRVWQKIGDRIDLTKYF